MSANAGADSDADAEDIPNPAQRDLLAELRSAEAGYSGIPVDAICCGCKWVRVKRVTPEEAGLHPQVDPSQLDPGDVGSFKHVCHRCQTVTWWNATSVLTGLLTAEQGRGE